VSPSRPLQLGSVVWAALEDANGYRKVSPENLRDLKGAERSGFL
jgi:hypothetical protein